ncbi:MAG: thiE [Rhodospirillales bacterium]|nr:thiE [Rhodospirillales bacterium]
MSQASPLPDRIFVIGNVRSDEDAARMPSYAAQLQAGGCRWFSLRAKAMDATARARLLDAVRAAAPGLILFVHGGVSSAADGVHLGADGSIAAARAAGAKRVGISAHSRAELQRALDEGADYATYSPIFPTTSKPGYGPALGLEALRQAAHEVALPVVALGGIERSNAQACLQAGARAVAVLGAFAHAADPAAAFAEMSADMRRSI